MRSSYAVSRSPGIAGIPSIRRLVPVMSHKKLGRLGIVAIFLLALTSPLSAELKEKVLYSFQGIPDGSLPIGGIVFDSAGNIYGATQDGGSSSCQSANQCGTVYQLAPPTKNGDPWTETVL